MIYMLLGNDDLWTVEIPKSSPPRVRKMEIRRPAPLVFPEDFGNPKLEESSLPKPKETPSPNENNKKNHSCSFILGMCALIVSGSFVYYCYHTWQ